MTKIPHTQPGRTRGGGVVVIALGTPGACAPNALAKLRRACAAAIPPPTSRAPSASAGSYVSPRELRYVTTLSATEFMALPTASAVVFAIVSEKSRSPSPRLAEMVSEAEVVYGIIPV